MFITRAVLHTATPDPNEVLVTGDVDGVPTNVLLRNAPDLKARYVKHEHDSAAKRDKMERGIATLRAEIDVDAFAAAVAQHDAALAEHARVKLEASAS